MTNRDVLPGRWALSRVVVEGSTITTAAVRNRLARRTENYFAPIAEGLPVLPWALVYLAAPIPLNRWAWRKTETRILPDLRSSTPLSSLSWADRSDLRALLEDELGPYVFVDDQDGSTIERDRFSGSFNPDVRWSTVLSRLFTHLGHSTTRARPALFETHNTAWTDDFATDTAANWSPWSSSTWTHDAGTGERSAPYGNSGGPKGFRYAAHNSGSLDHEAQVSGHLVAPFRCRMGLPAVRMASAQRDGYFVDVHTRFPSFDVNRAVNGVNANLLNGFSEPAGYALDSEEWLTMRLAATGAVGANVLLHLWARTETSTAKPADPGWVGVDASPGWTVTDTAANRLDDAVHTDCGIVNGVDGSSSTATVKYDYFRLRALADRGGADTTLAGAASGVGLVSASILTAITFGGSLAGLATLSGGLSTSVALGGSMAGVGSMAGTLSTAIGLVGSVAGVSSMAGDLVSGISLAGSAVGVATVSGLVVDAGMIFLQGSLDGIGTLVGSLVTGITLAGIAAGIALVKGNLVVEPATPGEGGVRWPETMADVSLVELVETQAITWIPADPQLSALIGGRVYTTIPESVVYPWVLLEAFLSSPWNRFRGFGRVVTFQCRAQSQVKGDYEVHRIGDRLTAVLEGRDVALPPAKRSLWSVDEASGSTFTDAESGVLTYHRPVGVRVRVQV